MHTPGDLLALAADALAGDFEQLFAVLPNGDARVPLTPFPAHGGGILEYAVR